MHEHVCRACRSRVGNQVLDLDYQPAADKFPARNDPGPDSVYPLQMWLCSACGLAQLLVDATVPEEPRGKEPAALVCQAADAVTRVAAVGLLPQRGRVAEYGSPHGGSWLDLLAPRGLLSVSAPEQAEVVLDCFGLMHAPDQATALAERAARVAPGGILLLQYHALDTIITLGQWNALRHGHYAYYSTTALVGMLAMQGFSARTAWSFDLYGGTVLLAAGRARDGTRPDDAVERLLQRDVALGVRDDRVLARLQRQAKDHASRLRRWLVAERAAGAKVVGYGAASRAVALLVIAGVDRMLLEAVVDASPAKQTRRMPGTDVPIVGPDYLKTREPDKVLLLLPDLLVEVRAAFPQVEASGAEWVDASDVGRGASPIE